MENKLELESTDEEINICKMQDEYKTSPYTFLHNYVKDERSALLSLDISLCILSYGSIIQDFYDKRRQLLLMVRDLQKIKQKLSDIMENF